MNGLHATPQVSRLLLGTLTALILLACMSAVAAEAPLTSDQFAPGWQQRARPLFNMGITHFGDRTKWYVPAMLPRGEYVLVQRKGDKAEVIEGYRLTIRNGFADEYVMLTPGYGDVEALPVADVPALKASPRPDAATLQ